MKDLTNSKFWLRRDKVKKIRNFFLKYYISIRYAYFNFLQRSRTYLRIILYLSVSIISLIVANMILSHLQSRYILLISSLNIYGSFSSNDSSTIITILLGFIGIIGVFLGLYYTAITSIYSLHYSKTSIDIKTFFAKKTFENIQVLLFVLILSTVQIAFILFNQPLYYFTFLIIMLLNTFAAAVYFSSYIKSLKFANLYNVDIDFNKFILRSVNTITYSRGKLANDLSFQYLVLRIVNKFLQNKENVKISLLSENPNQNDLAVILNNNMDLLLRYSKIKSDIPLNSKWFYQTDIYKSWFTSNEFSEVSLALNTGTTISTKKTHNFMWFEKFIHNQSISIMRKIELINKGLIYDYLEKYFYVIANTIDLSNYEYFFDQLDLLLKLIQTNFNSDIELVSIWLSGFTNLILVMNDKIYSLEIEKYYNSLCEIHKLNRRRIERKKAILNDEEWVSFINQLILEKDVEGKILTPCWYIKGITKDIFVKQMNSKMTIIDKILKYYDLKLKGLISSSDKLAIISILSSNEFDAKVKHHINSLLNKVDEIENYNFGKSFKSKFLNKIPMDDFLNSKKKKDIIYYEKLLGIEKPHNIELPDYIGYAYYNLVVLIFNQILEDSNHEVITKGIEILLVSMDTITNSIIKETHTDQDYMLNKIPIPYANIGIMAGMCFYEYILNRDISREQELTTIFNNYFLDITNGESRVKKFHIMLKLVMNSNVPLGLSEKYQHEFIYKIKANPNINFEITGFSNKLKTNIDIIDDFGLSSDIFGFDGDLIDIFAVRYFNKLLTTDFLEPRKGWNKKNVY